MTRLAFRLLRALACAALVAAGPVRAQLYNEQTPHYRDAVNALQAAALVVDGRELNSKTSVEYHGEYDEPGYVSRRPNGTGNYAYTTSGLLRTMGDYDAWAPAGEKIADGIMFGQAVAFFKDRLYRLIDDRQIVAYDMIERAYAAALGRAPYAWETNDWLVRFKARTAWYAPIVLEAWNSVRDDPVERRATIRRAYSEALCRDPTTAETAREMALGQNFTVTKRRATDLFLSPANEADLTKYLTFFMTASGQSTSPMHLAIWTAQARRRRLGCFALKAESGGKWTGEK